MLSFGFRRIFQRMTGLLFIISTVILAVALLSAGIVFFAFQNRFTEALEQSALSGNIQISRQVYNNMDSYFKDMLSIAEVVSDGIRDNPEGMRETVNLASKLRKDVETIVVLDSSGQPLTAPQGKSLKDDLNIYSQEWCDTRRLFEDGYVFSMPHLQMLFRGEYEWVVSLLYLTSWRDEDGLLRHGSVLVDVNFLSFDEICTKASYDNSGFVYIIDRYGGIVYHPAQQLIYLGLGTDVTTRFVGVPDGGMIGMYNGRRCAYSVVTLAEADWRVVRVDYLKSVMGFDTHMQRDILLVFGALVLGVLGVSFAVSYAITAPIRRLTLLVQDVQSRDFRGVTVSDFRVPREIRELAFAFDRMLGRIAALLEQIENEQAKIRRSEIKALQAQINPHFLYNTLDSIVWMAEAGENEGVTVMTAALADFFRMSISDSRDYITVEEELAYARNYLVIQEIRYRGKFDYSIEMEEGAARLAVTKILLQPLIENAIYHGLYTVPDQGHISVWAGLCGDRLLLRVSDNGCGMDDETLANILRLNPKKKSSIGVKNVHQRIQMLFGKEYGLEFSSELEEGTVVKIWLPIIPQGDAP